MAGSVSWTGHNVSWRMKRGQHPLSRSASFQLLVTGPQIVKGLVKKVLSPTLKWTAKYLRRCQMPARWGWGTSVSWDYYRQDSWTFQGEMDSKPTPTPTASSQKTCSSGLALLGRPGFICSTISGVKAAKIEGHDHLLTDVNTSVIQ